MPAASVVTTRGRAAAARSAFAAVLLAAGAGDAAGQWVSKPGEGWANLSVFHQSTSRQFGRNSNRRDVNINGQADNTVLFLTLNVGLFKGVDTWVQVPWQRVDFEDDAGDRLKTGIGDTRLWLRVAPLQYFGIDFPVAIRGGVKFEVADFEVDSEVITLGDGQRDWELMLEVGHSFWPKELSVNGWVGYRWREANDQILKDFGNEAFFFLQGSGKVTDRFGYELLVEGFDSKAPIIEQLKIGSAERQLLQTTPKLTYDAGPGTVKLGGQIPLWGTNLLSGPSVVIDYFVPFNLKDVLGF